MIYLIILGAVLYIMIGLIFNGFLDVDITDNFMMFLGVIMVWPAIIVFGMLLIITWIPYRFGKGLSDKYFDAVEAMFDKFCE